MALIDSTVVERIEARWEIHDALLRYCRGIDRCDEELVRSAYHDDALDVRGDSRVNGWELASATVNSVRQEFVRTTHILTNILIEVDGDTARSESYLFSYIWADSDGKENLSIVVARYYDRFERRGGRWAIAHRAMVLDWSVGHVAPEAWDNPGITGLVRGTHGRDDLSYELFKS